MSGRNVNEGEGIMKLFSDDYDVSFGDESKLEGIADEVWKKFVDEKRSSSTLEMVMMNVKHHGKRLFRAWEHKILQKEMKVIVEC